ncbi:MAG: C10 family peptidase [Spirochaetales bacterium]|nr:C10 family peptidase [Spirochaetales bacterium]
MNPEILPLLKTSWKQRDGYARFTPDNQRLGCWSVALAQILFYHGLVPAGSTSYQGTHYDVSADFDHPPVKIDAITAKIDSDTPEKSAIETARFLYYVSLITGKDFGTGGYIGNTDVRRARLEKHFPVKTSRIRYPESSKDQIIAFITGELAEKRPLLIYITGSTVGEEGKSHALVIDGLRNSESGVEVHLNFGWEGVSDGWFTLFQPIQTKYGLYDKPDLWIMKIITLKK